MTIHREYMTHDPVKPDNDVYHCHGCGFIYRSKAKKPKCPKGQERCAGTIQRATRREVG